MVEKDIELIGRVANLLNVNQRDVLNTPFVEIIEMLTIKLEIEQKRMKMNQFLETCIRTAQIHDDLVEELKELALGITGEAGEVADLLKKSVYHGHDWKHEKTAFELGDVLYYVTLYANAIGYSLEEIANMNVQKRYARYPNGFNSDDSINRKE